MDAAMRSAANALDGEVEVVWTLDYPGVLYTEESPLVKAAERAACAAGLPASFAVSGGGADTNVFGRVGLVPLTLGIGMQRYHSLDEQIAVDDLEGTARFAYELIRQYA